MATRTIEGYLTTTNAGTILTPGQLLTATITSYEASTSGTITAVSVSFSRNIVLYSTSSLKLYLNNTDHGTTATYSNNTASFDFVEYSADLLTIEPTSVYFVVNSGSVYYNSSQPTFTITITYNESTTTPTLSTPGDPVISYTPGAATFTVSWSPASGSNGTGVVTYNLFMQGSGYVIYGEPVTSYTGPVPEAGTYNFRVTAFYGSLSQESNAVSYTFEESTVVTPTLNNPGIPYVSYTPGNNYYQVSWDAATVSNGDTNITYSLLEINNSIFVARNLSTPSFTSYEVPIAGTEYRFRVFAYYGDQITQNENPDNYIFPELIKQSTVGYYTNGAWQECVVYYYDGSEWVECIPYYYNNGWQEINTKIE